MPNWTETCVVISGTPEQLRHARTLLGTGDAPLDYDVAAPELTRDRPGHAAWQPGSDHTAPRQAAPDDPRGWRARHWGSADRATDHTVSVQQREGHDVTCVAGTLEPPMAWFLSVCAQIRQLGLAVRVELLSYEEATQTTVHVVQRSAHERPEEREETGAAARALAARFMNFEDCRGEDEED